jgi:hypothetical protein
MSSRKGLIAVMLALAFVLLTVPTGIQGASISEVSHEPAIPKAGEGVDITVKFSDVSNVTVVSIIYCTIEPFKCAAPANMIRDSSDNTIFTYTITKDYNPGTKIGFKFKIQYDDGRPVEDFPKSQADSSLHEVYGPIDVDDSYYFTYTLKSESTQDLTLFFIVLAVLIVAFIPLIVAALLLMKKRKAKGREDEDEK